MAGNPLAFKLMIYFSVKEADKSIFIKFYFWVEVNETHIVQENNVCEFW